MRFYTKQRRDSCGIDLHARTMSACILKHEGEMVFHRNLPSTPAAFLRAIAAYRDDLVVAVECLVAWYWLADLCAREGIAFVLGHALYMKAIHGGKAKHDRSDAHTIAVLLRGGMLPMAYAYPAEMRATRDLLRRRCHLTRKRAELLAHIQGGKAVTERTLKSLTTFVDRFKALNFVGDVAIERQLDELRTELLSQYPAGEFRDNAMLTGLLKDRLEAIATQAESISDRAAITGEYRRKIQRAPVDISLPVPEEVPV